MSHLKSSDESSAPPRRLGAFICSLALLGLICSGMFHQIVERRVSPILPLSIVAAYFLVSGIIVTVICARLFSQHEFRRLRFDLANLMLLTTLLLLPLAAANALWGVFAVNGDEGAIRERPGIVLATTAGLVFSLYPFVIVMEAVLFWCSATYRWLKKRYLSANV